MALMQINLDPDAITCKANGTITAGDFVKTVSSDDVVTSSGISSFIPDDLLIERADASGDEGMVIGIAAEDASKGDFPAVYTQGLFIVRAGEGITAGYRVKKAASTDYLEIEEVNAATDTYSAVHPIGIALTGASEADKYVVILLRV